MTDQEKREYELGKQWAWEVAIARGYITREELHDSKVLKKRLKNNDK